MGRIGKKIGAYLGHHIGRYAGRKLGKYTGIGEDKGGVAGTGVGSILGELLPFKKGGRINKTGKALVHKGEFILPRGVKPTAAQRKRVKSGRKRR